MHANAAVLLFLQLCAHGEQWLDGRMDACAHACMGEV